MATIQTCCKLLVSNKAKERHEGHAELRRLLEAYDGSLVNQMDYTIWIDVLKCFFKSVEHECAEYITKKPLITTRSTIEQRLTQLAKDLRRLVDVCGQLPDMRIPRTILRHVANVLLLPNDELCWPLVLDYTRAIINLLSHRPHRHQLQESEWESLLQLCARGLLTEYMGHETSTIGRGMYAGYGNSMQR
jgi:hypothetical protein